MKIFTNLPGSLCALFGILRLVTVLMGFFWFLNLVFSFGLYRHFNIDHGPQMTIGDVLLRVDPNSLRLTTSDAQEGALTLQSLRATLQASLGNGETALRSAVLKTAAPGMAVVILTGYLLFTALRSLCANLERGNVFSEENLRLMRRVGLTLIGSSLASVATGLWAAAVMNSFLREHVTLNSGAQHPDVAGMVQFSLPPGLLSIQGGLIAGFLVLMLTEAFRQGLNLKTENDLTV